MSIPPEFSSDVESENESENESIYDSSEETEENEEFEEFEETEFIQILEENSQEPVRIVPPSNPPKFYEATEGALWSEIPTDPSKIKEIEFHRKDEMEASYDLSESDIFHLFFTPDILEK